MPDSSQIRLVEAILALPTDLKPSYKVVGVQDVSFGSVRRYVVSISLPPNLKKETVEQNFKQAILQIYREKAANAITVWGFKEGDNIAQLYTVGEAVFAPNGVWENAGENNKDLQNYKTTINLKDSYFNPQKVLSAGDSITLSAHNTDDKKPETVRVWKDETNRFDSNVLLEVPNGTKVRFLEKKQSRAGTYVSSVYKVEVNQKTDWVDSIDVSDQ